jgi:predicted RNase H-like nuclease
MKLIIAGFGEAFSVARQAIHKRQASDDDIMDAFAALWNVGRILSGRAVTIPSNPPRDGCGLRMEMVA